MANVETDNKASGTGRIMRSLSGFYDVRCGDTLVRCRARGKLRLSGLSPLVGDMVRVEQGVLMEILPRRNVFVRPAVANMDLLLILCCNVNPITDPFLSDRMAAVAALSGVQVAVLINKVDLDPGDTLYEIYTRSGYQVLRTSAVTGVGLEALHELIRGKTCAFAGNSGAGKSSLLNALYPDCQALVAPVSRKLGRGRHTTRHVELFDLGEGTALADTPGFSSFDLTQMPPIAAGDLVHAFPEFQAHLGKCRFDDCTHRKEPGCAVRDAMERGEIHPSRYASYVRLYDVAASYKAWEHEN